MTMQDKSAPTLLAIGTSIGTVFGLLLVGGILYWPEVVLSAETIRLVLGLVVLLAYLSFKERRQNRRHAELKRLLKYGSVADEAERMLRDG